MRRSPCWASSPKHWKWSSTPAACFYGFHRLSGTADLALQEAVAMLREAGHAELADDIAEALVGRDIISDQWSFQLVEDYDAGYWQVFRDVEQHARTALGVPARHVYEAEMKQREQGS